MNKLISFSGPAVLLASLLLVGHVAFSADDTQLDEELVGYDQIVRELSAAPDASSKAKARPTYDDPFADVMIHGGIGLASTFGQLRTPSGESIRMNQQGMQAALGIDLFSKNWFAEGTARTFGSTVYNSASSVKLKEFDLKLYYKDRITNGINYRLGGGLAARYLTIESRTQGRTDYTTPSTVLAGGVDMYLTRAISVGAEITARNSIIDETIDKTAFDGTIRLDTHF